MQDYAWAKSTRPQSLSQHIKTTQCLKLNIDILEMMMIVNHMLCGHTNKNISYNIAMHTMCVLASEPPHPRYHLRNKKAHVPFHISHLSTLPTHIAYVPAYLQPANLHGCMLACLPIGLHTCLPTYPTYTCLHTHTHTHTLSHTPPCRHGV
jgi:hypothetical protein